MKHVLKTLTVILLAAVYSIAGFGCSKLMGPSDEEVVKAISESSFFKENQVALASPIVILEKGNKEQDGTWPVKVKLSMAVPTLDGKIRTVESSPVFKIFKGKDNTGKTVWQAKVR